MGPQKHKVERRLVAIFAADVAGYSRLMAQDEVQTLGSLGPVPARFALGGFEHPRAPYQTRTASRGASNVSNLEKE